MSEPAEVVSKGAPYLAASILKLQVARRTLNNWFCYEPIFLIGGTAILVHFLHQCYDSVPNEGVWEGLKRYFWKTMRRLPFVKRKIDSEISTLQKSINKDMIALFKGNDLECHFIRELPCTGLKNEEILERIQNYLSLGSYTWSGGKVSGTVYHGGDDLTALTTQVYGISAWTNPLHPDVFPGVCKMEGEIVRMVAELFHGNEKACGTVTSGGTESIILAVKAYRDWAKEKRGIKYPEILVPVTAHAAFDKAAQLLNIKIRHVPTNPSTCKVDLAAMESMINKNTCMIVGSAPAYPHGCIDDIQKLSELGLCYRIPVHVDACLGGFLIAFMPKAGFSLPPFDFALPGVTSISADTHKYGFAPKGSSVLLFRDIKFKHFQYFLVSDWPGGLYGSPTIAGSRPGALIAGCWSSLLHFGMNGYIETTRRIIQTARTIEEGLRKIPGIYVMGNPQVSVVAFTSDVFDILRVSDALSKKGWSLNNLQFPSSIHICVTYRHTEPGVAEKFIQDVSDTVHCAMKDPSLPATGGVAMYGMSQKVPDRSLVKELTAVYLDSLYLTECDNEKKKESIIQNVPPKFDQFYPYES